MFVFWLFLCVLLKFNYNVILLKFQQIILLLILLGVCNGPVVRSANSSVCWPTRLWCCGWKSSPLKKVISNIYCNVRQSSQSQIEVFYGSLYFFLPSSCMAISFCFGFIWLCLTFSHSHTHISILGPHTHTPREGQEWTMDSEVRKWR